MADQAIDEICINASGSLCVTPVNAEFPYIYRAGMEVSWNEDRKCLYGPKPREWSYFDWFRQICAAADSEYATTLKITQDTRWVNIEDELKKEILNAV